MSFGLSFSPPQNPMDFSKIELKDHLAGKKVIMVGLPGAFTPT